MAGRFGDAPLAFLLAEAAKHGYDYVAVAALLAVSQVATWNVHSGGFKALSERARAARVIIRIRERPSRRILPAWDRTCATLGTCHRLSTGFCRSCYAAIVVSVARGPRQAVSALLQEFRRSATTVQVVAESDSQSPTRFDRRQSSTSPPSENDSIVGLGGSHEQADCRLDAQLILSGKTCLPST